MEARAVRCSGFFLRGVSLVHGLPNTGNKYETPRAEVVKFGVVPLARGMRGTRTAEVAGGIREFHLPSGMGEQEHATRNTMNLRRNPRAPTGKCRAADPRPGRSSKGRWAYGEKCAACCSPNPAMITSQA